MNSQYDQGGYFFTREVVWSVSGEKAAKFLQGQLSNDILALAVGDGNYNLLLTVKGKIVADLFVYRVAESEFYICLKREVEAKVLDHLQKLAPLSRVSVTAVDPPPTVLHIITPPLTPALSPRGRGSPYDPLSLWGEGQGEGGRTLAFKSNRLGASGLDLIIPADKLEECLEKLREQKISPIPDDVQEVIRIENGICKVGVDATEDNLPQEARLIHAISFTKGCYLGQEIVARLQYRGHVNKILVGLVFDSAELPPLQSPALTSCIFSPKLKKPLGLGYVLYAMNKTGEKFEIGGHLAKIIELPL